MTSLEGKVIAITGGASGMGFAIAKLVTSRGATVSLADLSKSRLQEAVNKLSGKGHLTQVLDVRDGEAVEQWIQRTVKELGQLDGAVNFAGVISVKRLVDTTEEDWDFNMDINAKGVFFCLRAELRYMKAGASIVSAASVDGQIGWPTFSAYCASKHAVIGVSRCAAKEHPEIRVNCVAPGCVDTPMMAGESAEVSPEVAEQVQKRKANPTEIANVVAFLLSDDASFVTGAVYNVDGGWAC